MNPRPVLLIEVEDDAQPMDSVVRGALEREGYFVLFCGKGQSRTLKVVTLAPCPFTQADVDLVRSLANGCPPQDGEEYATVAERVVLRSIADRIQGMLDQEVAGG